MWLKDFGNKESEARQALKIIKHYKMNSQCFVGRPGPSLEYYLVNGKAPVGAMPGEDAVPFDPNNAQVTNIGGRWKIVDGTHWILDFAEKKVEADTALKIIKKYKFSYICFVGRPGASMTYFRVDPSTLHLAMPGLPAWSGSFSYLRPKTASSLTPTTCAPRSSATGGHWLTGL